MDSDAIGAVLSRTVYSHCRGNNQRQDSSCAEITRRELHKAVKGGRVVEAGNVVKGVKIPLSQSLCSSDSDLFRTVDMIH